MIVCKYRRYGVAAYMPHVDTIRFFGMAIRRADLPIKFSEGYNPHMLLYFSGPPPIGMESECEYMVVDSPAPADVFMDRINRTLPDTLKIVRAGNIDSCNIAAMACAAAYEIRLTGASAEKTIAGVMEKDSLPIRYTVKGKEIEKDVRAQIYDLKAEHNTIYAVLAYGNNNLRAERLIKNLLKMSLQTAQDIDILKKMMYTYTNTGLIDLDDLLFKKE